MYQAIAYLPDDASARAAFDRISGEIHASMRGATMEDTRFVREAMVNRTIGPRERGKGLWLHGYGSRGSTDGDGNAAEVNRDIAAGGRGSAGPSPCARLPFAGARAYGGGMRLSDCHNVQHFRALARKRLPGPVFHYIDGAADDELTKGRNTRAFDDVDLVPDVLAGVSEIDMSVTVLGRKLAMPLFLSPTALQRLFHWEGERAVGRAASAFGTYFGVSSLSTVSLEDIGRTVDGPKMLQLYVHKDEGLNQSLVERARNSGFDCLTLTVDTIVGGNRERCLRTGFTSPPRFTASSVWEYATKPSWALNYLFREKFSLPNLAGHLPEGSSKSMSVADYFTQMLDQTLDWKRAEAIRKSWGDKPFCLKGVMSVADAKRAIDIGATAIMVSNHGGRQLDGSRAPFDQIAELADAVGDRIEIICDGGIQRGTHVLKALAAGAKACSGGRLYLYALGAAGEPGVRSILSHLRGEIERDMKLMGVTRVDQLDRSKLRYR